MTKHRSCQTNGLEQRLTREASEISRGGRRAAEQVWQCGNIEGYSPMHQCPTFQENGRTAYFRLLQGQHGPNARFCQWNTNGRGLRPFSGDAF